MTRSNMTQGEALATHEHQTNLQKIWEGEKQAAEHQGLPFDKSYPNYTVPAPFSPEFYKLRNNPQPTSDWYKKGLGAASYNA